MAIEGRLAKLEQRLTPPRMPELTIIFTWRTPEERIHAEAVVLEHRRHENTPRLPGQGIIKYASKEFGI